MSKQQSGLRMSALLGKHNEKMRKKQRSEKETKKNYGN